MKIVTVINMFYKLANDLDLFSLDITPDNIEQVLQQITESVQEVDGIEDASVEELKTLLDNMKNLIHSDDEHHYGESILDHTKKVLSNIEQLTNELDDKTKQLMRLVALCHDLGKAFTHEIKEKDSAKKHTFYGHAKKSVEILTKLINQQILEREEYKNLIVLVKEHDEILSIYSQRGNSLKYIKNIISSDAYTYGLFELQIAFAKADSVTQAALDETNKMVEIIRSDITTYNKQQKEKEQADILRAAEIQNLIETKGQEISELFSVEPTLLALWPDAKAIRAEIGRMKNFDLMKKFNSIIPAK